MIPSGLSHNRDLNSSYNRRRENLVHFLLHCSVPESELPARQDSRQRVSIVLYHGALAGSSQAYFTRCDSKRYLKNEHISYPLPRKSRSLTWRRAQTHPRPRQGRRWPPRVLQAYLPVYCEEPFPPRLVETYNWRRKTSSLLFSPHRWLFCLASSIDRLDPPPPHPRRFVCPPPRRRVRPSAPINSTLRVRNCSRGHTVTPDCNRTAPYEPSS